MNTCIQRASHVWRNQRVLLLLLQTVSWSSAHFLLLCPLSIPSPAPLVAPTGMMLSGLAFSTWDVLRKNELWQRWQDVYLCWSSARFGTGWASDEGEVASSCQNDLLHSHSFFELIGTRSGFQGNRKAPKHWLLGGLEHFIFPYIGNVIIPTDELHHFSEGF